ncbi:MAG: signal recognition particle-docking protein FtsY [Gammaproteobacteria bacterium]|nr:signal recognition particle-docking protein FtsY [Gammaproteobacteria bacterium]
MLNFLKKKQAHLPSSWWQRLSAGLVDLFSGKVELDDDTLERLETHLLMADVGIEATAYILEQLTIVAKQKKITTPDTLHEALKSIMTEMLSVRQEVLDPRSDSPFVILMVGINGAGKTTTIGKLARYFKAKGKSVMLAAGDTFRAAAIEQLATWGQRNEVSVIAQQHGADSASVIFDALQSAKAKKIDILLADTAGRLHTQQGLMAELVKIKRVLQKVDPKAPHEVLLVLDASIGQNALKQAKEFDAAIGVTGIVMTKLDGSAKGGMLFSIAKNLDIPIRFIGIGESIEDMQPFDAATIVEAIFSERES